MPNQVIQKDFNVSNNDENNLTKEDEYGKDLSFQINGEDCSIEFEESNATFDIDNVIEKDNSNASNDGDENIVMNSTPTNELTINCCYMLLTSQKELQIHPSISHFSLP